MEVDTAGDEALTTFENPAQGVACACGVLRRLNEVGISVRAGIHTGECEVLDGRVTGIAVHLGARIAASAAATEVLVSSTVKDLVAGSGIDFDDRGLHDLRGVPGQLRLLAVKAATVI